MGIINSISNYISLNWESHPVSHLDENSKVKPFSLYKEEVKAFLHKIYEEHEKIISDKESGIIYRSISFAGKILSLNYSFKELTSDVSKTFSSPISPVNHYNYQDRLKTKAEFKQDLKAKLGEIYDYHLTLEKFDNSTYTELTCNKIGESAANLLSLDIVNAGINLVSAACYGSAGIVLTILNSKNIIKNIASQVTVENSDNHNSLPAIEMTQYDMIPGDIRDNSDLYNSTIS